MAGVVDVDLRRRHRVGLHECSPATRAFPRRTDAKVSGLPNGTYFWRVKATQIVGGAIFSIDSPWSAVRSFTVVGLGPAPGRPSFTSPASGARFHVREFFLITWTAVPGRASLPAGSRRRAVVLVPVDAHDRRDAVRDELPRRLGQRDLNIFYRVVAVSADGVRGLPSPTLNVQITNAAPVPPAPTPAVADRRRDGARCRSRSTGPTRPTRRCAGYDLDIDDEPNFQGTVGVLLVQGVTRSDYMVVPDPLLEGKNIFPPGTYFWRVRAVHGDVFGPWSAGQSFTVRRVARDTAGAVDLPHHQRARQRLGRQLDAGAGDAEHARAGGRRAHQARQRHAACRRCRPASSIPAGKTDATVSPITTIPVPGATIGSVRAAYGLGWQDNSLGLFPILWGVALSDESVIGGELRPWGG